MTAKRARGFSAVGLTVTIMMVAAFSILAAPYLERWVIRSEASAFVSTLVKIAEDAEFFYQANCSSPSLTPDLSDLRGQGLLTFHERIKSPWRGDAPELQFLNWGTSNPRVNLILNDVPKRYLSAIKEASEFIVIQGSTVVFDRSVAFSYDEQQRSLISKSRLFDDSGC